MKDVNRVQRIGHLGQDPEVTYTATGIARTTFSVATRARCKDASSDGRQDRATIGAGSLWAPPRFNHTRTDDNPRAVAFILQGAPSVPRGFPRRRMLDA